MLRFTMRARAVIAVLAICGTLFFARGVSAGQLGTLAATMAPGSWAELTGMNAWDSGKVLVPLELGCSQSDYITQFAEKAAWDPVNNRVLFLGHSHGYCYGGRFLIYSEATNTWSQGPWPSGMCQSGSVANPCFSHGYDHNTVDPLTGDMYLRQYYTTNFYRFRNGEWSRLPSPPMQSSQCCGALEYFPDLNRLIFVDGDWGVWSYNPTSNAWTQLANTSNANSAAGLPNLPMTPYNNFALYNPAKKVMIFGGGKSLYKLDSSGKIAALKAPPVGLGPTYSVLSVDAPTGSYIVLSGSAMYQFDVSADVWAPVSTNIPQELLAMGGIGDGLIQAPITRHGVIMYIKYNFANSKVYLYKHSAVSIRVPKSPENFSIR